MALNDILFSEEFLFEGEAADAHRAKRAAEAKQKIDQEKRDRDRQADRFKKIEKSSHDFNEGLKKRTLKNPNRADEFVKKINDLEDRVRKTDKKFEDRYGADVDKYNTTQLTGANKAGARYAKEARKVVNKHTKVQESIIYGGLELI